MTIGERIKQVRESKGLLQKEVADRLHVSPEAISQWETDRRTKGFERLASLAQALGVSEAELLGHTTGESDALAQLGFTPDDLTGFTEEQLQTMRAALLSLMTTFREHNQRADASHDKKATSIFIIDDEIKLCHLLAKAFRSRGYEADYAFNGQSAINRIVAGKTRPTIILLDLKMPKMDGAHFLRQLRTIHHGSKIVIVSANVDAAAELQANHTVDGFIAKPFRLEEVVQTVEQVVGA